LKCIREMKERLNRQETKREEEKENGAIEKYSAAG
jgi:hypothetical protein